MSLDESLLLPKGKHGSGSGSHIGTRQPARDLHQESASTSLHEVIALYHSEYPSEVQSNGAEKPSEHKLRTRINGHPQKAPSRGRLPKVMGTRIDPPPIKVALAKVKVIGSRTFKGLQWMSSGAHRRKNRNSKAVQTVQQVWSMPPGSSSTRSAANEESVNSLSRDPVVNETHQQNGSVHHNPYDYAEHPTAATPVRQEEPTNRPRRSSTASFTSAIVKSMQSAKNYTRLPSIRRSSFTLFPEGTNLGTRDDKTEIADKPEIAMRKSDEDKDIADNSKAEEDELKEVKEPKEPVEKDPEVMDKGDKVKPKGRRKNGRCKPDTIAPRPRINADTIVDALADVLCLDILFLCTYRFLSQLFLYWYCKPLGTAVWLVLYRYARSTAVKKIKEGMEFSTAIEGSTENHLVVVVPMLLEEMFLMIVWLNGLVSLF